MRVCQFRHYGNCAYSSSMLLKHGSCEALVLQTPLRLSIPPHLPYTLKTSAELYLPGGKLPQR
jgi:hypothetical protein